MPKSMLCGIVSKGEEEKDWGAGVVQESRQGDGKWVFFEQLLCCYGKAGVSFLDV